MQRSPSPCSARPQAIALALGFLVALALGAAPAEPALAAAPAGSALAAAPTESALALPAPPTRSLRAVTRPPALLTRPGDPLSWVSFEQCLEVMERWAGRQIPDWVVHTATFRYPMRRPLYDLAGDPLRDADGKPRWEPANGTGRVFFPPAWRLRRSPRLPLVVYAHATMMNKADSPSEFGGHEWVLAAAAAAYYGFAVAMPDQPGMGGDRNATHSFCHARSLAYATLDALPEVRRLAAEDPYLVQRGYAWDGRLYLLGYSEGGYAALAAVKELAERPMEYPDWSGLTGAACMAGPFDLSGTTRELIIDPKRPFSHCFYLPFVVLAYQDIYPGLVDSRAAFAPELLERRPDGDILAWTDGSHSGLEVDTLIGRRLGAPANAVVMRRILNPAWTAQELDDPAYATSAVHKLLAQNDLCRGWKPARPILFCQSPADQDVPVRNTRITLEALGAEIRKAGDDPARSLAFLPLGREADGIGHVQGALLAIPAAFNWIYSGMPMR